MKKGERGLCVVAMGTCISLCAFFVLPFGYNNLGLTISIGGLIVAITGSIMFCVGIAEDEQCMH